MRYADDFFRFWRQILIHIKIMQMSYVNFSIKHFVAFCRHTCLLPSLQKLVNFVENWNIERYLSLVPLRKKYPKMRLFRKMAPISTSCSGFHVIFEFRVLDLIENDINIDRLCGRFFEILGVKVENFKKLCKWVTCILQEKFIRLYVAIAGPYRRGEI